jgi:tRNA(fMet)-specific endonuclease VapC
MYLLDTNTLVYFFRGEGQVAQRLLAAAPSSIRVPAVVVYELETGLAKSAEPKRRRRQLDTLLSVVEVIPFGMDEARAAAKARARLEVEGTPIGPVDTLVAGVALAHRAVLVTHNTREFGRVSGLRLEDWY